MSRPAGLGFSHPGVNGWRLRGRGRAGLWLGLSCLWLIAAVPVGRVLIVRISVAVHVRIGLARALAKPRLVVRGHSGPGLTGSTVSRSSSSSGGHHVGHEVGGRQEGRNNTTGLLPLLTTLLDLLDLLARGELTEVLSHLSGLEKSRQSLETNREKKARKY